MAQVTIDRELLERIDESAICDGTDATISDDLFTQLVAALDAPRQPDGWKLVPVEPTPEMVSAAEEAYMPFGDMDIALRMAILAAPSAPKADDPVKVQLLEALEELMYAHTDKAEALATAAIAAARKGEGK